MKDIELAEKAVSANYDMLYTSDLARIALAVGAASCDPTAVGGHNLIEAIAKADFNPSLIPRRFPVLFWR